MKMIINIWNGNLSLGKTFWLVFMLGTSVLTIISFLIEENYENISEVGALFSLIFILFFYIYLIYSYVGTWRSASKYAMSAKKKRKGAGWAYAAQTVVVLSAISGLVEIIRTII